MALKEAVVALSEAKVASPEAMVILEAAQIGDRK